MKNRKFLSRNSRMAFLHTSALCAAALIFFIVFISFKSSNSNKPDSNFNGVQIGVISYSWRSMPGTAEDILKYCLQSGISSVELM